MNELLQKHGCSNVFTIPEGLKELMADISREVLRDQPAKIYDYISNYLSVLIITREHGILSVKILDDLCDCRPLVSEHLAELGFGKGEAAMIADIIKQEIEDFEPEEGKEKVKETQILKKILSKLTLDEEMAARVCQVARNAYRDYWYRKRLMEKNLNIHPHEDWEVAAERTLEIYKRTKPSYTELTRATQKIQAAYRGYYVRRNLLSHLKPKKAKTHPKVDLPGPPRDIAGSREIDLGPVINVRVREEDTTAEFDKQVGKALNVGYDPMKTITHVYNDEAPPKGSTLQVGGKAAARKYSFKGAEQPDPLEEAPYKLPHLDGDVEAHKPTPSQLAVGAAVKQDEPEQNLNKIKFASKHDEKVISEINWDKKPEEAEIPEEIPADQPPMQQEEAPEVPEDIVADFRSEGDGDSAPEADDSAPEADDSAPAPEVDDSAPAPEVDESAPAPEVDDNAPAPEADDSAPEADYSAPEPSEPESAPVTEDEAE